MFGSKIILPSLNINILLDNKVSYRQLNTIKTILLISFTSELKLGQYFMRCCLLATHIQITNNREQKLREPINALKKKNNNNKYKNAGKKYTIENNVKIIMNYIFFRFMNCCL